MSSYYDTEDFVRTKSAGEIRISKRVEPAIPQRYAAMRKSEDSSAFVLTQDARGGVVDRQSRLRG